MEKVIADLMEKRNKAVKPEEAMLWEAYSMPRCDIEGLKEENQQLKELLKQCIDEIEYLRRHYKGNIDHFKNNTRLDKEINQAIGEKK